MWDNMWGVRGIKQERSTSGVEGWHECHCDVGRDLCIGLLWDVEMYMCLSSWYMQRWKWSLRSQRLVFLEESKGWGIYLLNFWITESQNNRNDEFRKTSGNCLLYIARLTRLACRSLACEVDHFIVLAIICIKIPF